MLPLLDCGRDGVSLGGLGRMQENFPPLWLHRDKNAGSAAGDQVEK
jgi:hypothetical protein